MAEPLNAGFLLLPRLARLDFLCVPGGPGVAAAMEDTGVSDFLRRRAA